MRGHLDAEDLAPETLWHAWRRFHQFQSEMEAALRAWLRRTLERVQRDAVDHCCAPKRDVHRQHGSVHANWTSRAPTGLEILLPKEREERLRHAVAQLPAQKRQLVADLVAGLS